MLFRSTSIMLVNDAEQARNVRVRMPSATQSSLYSYHYFKNDRPISSSEMLKASVGVLKVDSNRSLTINMPSRGVIFLTSAAGRDTRPPRPKTVDRKFVRMLRGGLRNSAKTSTNR